MTTAAQQEFRRGRHLLFAAAAILLVSALAQQGWGVLDWLGVSDVESPQSVVLWRLVPLTAVALLAWLALEVFDTHAGVALVGSNWWKIGWEPWALCATLGLVKAVGRQRLDPDTLREFAHQALLGCYDEYSGVAWGWLFAAKLAGAMTEEIVFRGLLQRALEGYIGAKPAVYVQAIIFHLVHVYGYQNQYIGLHVFSGVAFGIAFMRTRSLLLPVLLHAALNMLGAIVYAPLAS